MIFKKFMSESYKKKVEKIYYSGKKAETDETKSLWKIRMEDIPAGGLYRIESCLKEEKKYPAGMGNKR